MAGLYLPPGASAMPEDIQRKLQFGDDSIGWPGNPNMWIQKCDGKPCKGKCKNDGWILCESPRTGGTRYVMHNFSSRVSESFLVNLAEQARKTSDQNLAEIDAHNDKRLAEIKQEQDERNEEGARRLDHFFKKNGGI